MCGLVFRSDIFSFRTLSVFPLHFQLCARSAGSVKNGEPMEECRVIETRVTLYFFNANRREISAQWRLWTRNRPTCFCRVFAAGSRERVKVTPLNEQEAETSTGLKLTSPISSFSTGAHDLMLMLMLTGFI